MIARVWRGWTTREYADVYEALLNDRIFPDILEKKIAGLDRIELFRMARDTEEEFMTVMWFDAIDSVRAFVGADIGVAYVPPEARAVLARFDPRSSHYELRTVRKAD